MECGARSSQTDKPKFHGSLPHYLHERHVLAHYQRSGEVVILIGFLPARISGSNTLTSSGFNASVRRFGNSLCRQRFSSCGRERRPAVPGMRWVNFRDPPLCQTSSRPFRRSARQQDGLSAAINTRYHENTTISVAPRADYRQLVQFRRYKPVDKFCRQFHAKLLESQDVICPYSPVLL